MLTDLPAAGAASHELMAMAAILWMEVAKSAGLDLTGFDPRATLDERLAWARSQLLAIGAALSRFSTRMQCSTESQIREIITFAAQHRIYIPPEFLCSDEGVSGRKTRRDGLTRVKQILAQKRAGVLLVYKVSRLFRSAYKGYAFFQEEVVDEGLRAISTSQGIDTADAESWRLKTSMHGIMDEMQLSTIADFVRSGQSNLFEQGFVTGALTLGYRPKEVPGGRPTKKGGPRMEPEINPAIADMIRQHYQWIAEGMSLREGCRRWNEVGGAVDPRSTTGRMTAHAYRRMLTNSRYCGDWRFGMKRNQWKAKLDYTVQVDQDPDQVKVQVREDLRIVSDKLFWSVQAQLADNTQGPRGPKKQRTARLCDLVVDCFVCHACAKPYHQAGVNGRSMHCPGDETCPCHVVVARQPAVAAVCETLAELLKQDEELVQQIVSTAQQFDEQGDAAPLAEIEKIDAQISLLCNKLDDLTEVAGHGSAEDRAEIRAKISATQGSRAELRHRRQVLAQALVGPPEPITTDRVRGLLFDLAKLLEDGAEGKLGTDVIYRAADVFRQLVGGRIVVRGKERPGRKRRHVIGTFTPAILATTKKQLHDPSPSELPEPREVTVELRDLPRLDRLTERVHQLVDIDGVTYRDAADQITAEGTSVTEAAVWQIRRRYFQMRELPVPKLRNNNGRPRKPR